MILKALTLENFKGIREPVRIELSPITLLFGPNNAGKSTVLHALIYARELFERGNADPRYTELGGETIDLGGFDSLVFGNDRSRQIRMRFEFEVSSNELMKSPGGTLRNEGPGADIDNSFRNESRMEGPSSEGGNILEAVRRFEIEKIERTKKTKWDDWHSSIDLCPESLTTAVKRTVDTGGSKWLEVKIGWSEQHQRPLLLSCLTGVSDRDRPSIELTFDDESKCLMLTQLDFGTLVLGKIDTPESRECRYGITDMINEHVFPIDRQKDISYLLDYSDEDFYQQGSDLPPRKSLQAWVDAFNALEDFEISTFDLLRGLLEPEFLTDEGRLPFFQVAYGFSGLSGLTREVSIACLCDGIDCYDDGSRGFVRAWQEREWRKPWAVAYLFLDPVINAFLAGFVRCCRDFFVSSRYLSAIRVNPPRDFNPVLPVDPKRWANGLAAWDLLFEKEGELPELVNDWLSGNPGRFGSGFEVKVQHTKQVDVRHSPVVELLTGADGVTLDQVRQYLLELPEHRLLRVLNLATGALGHPRDIGYGLSQLLPVIVAALDTKTGFVSVEEPESNIHPAFQVVLADLFISQAKANPGALFLIETHSEHLMLRCLRRIRQTSDGELTEGDPSLRPDEIAVHFVEPSEGSPRYHRIRIDADGEFLDPWPRGFFSERMKEVYGNDL